MRAPSPPPLSPGPRLEWTVSALTPPTASQVRMSSVLHPSGKSRVNAGAWKKAGHAADQAYRVKNNKYRPLALREGATMMPLAIETYGWAHPEVHAFLTIVAKETVDAGLSDQSAGAFPSPKVMIGRHYSYLLQRLSVTLLRGNAQAVIDFARKANKSSWSAAAHNGHRAQSRDES